MPLPHQGEKLSSFIGRFMSSKRERRNFPDPKQRLAVGYAEARRRSGKDNHGKA
jgi:hypothetical protein